LLYFCNSTPVSVLRTPELIRGGNGDFQLLSVESGDCYFLSKGGEGETKSALLFNGAVSTFYFPLFPPRAAYLQLSSRRGLLTVNLEGVCGQSDTAAQPVIGVERLINGYVGRIRKQGESMMRPSLTQSEPGLPRQ
jgi:hypothetical protein